MDQIKIGKFISERRKALKLTQEELGEKLGVSKNAVSKWERGLNLPDSGIYVYLCEILNISLNELFKGDYIKECEIQKQSEKNILNILQFNGIKNKKYRLLIILISILLLIAIIILSKCILIKYGYVMSDNLKYSKMYINKEDIKGNVDINFFGYENIDFDIGANKYGYAVFKNPKKAFKTLKKEYSDGIKIIQKEFKLPPLNNFTYKSYKTYGWQVTTGTPSLKKEAKFVTLFLDIYENSFN